MQDCQVPHDKINPYFNNIITYVYDRYYRYYDVNNIIARSNALEKSKHNRDVLREMRKNNGNYRTSTPEQLKIDDLYKRDFLDTPPTEIAVPLASIAQNLDFFQRTDIKNNPYFNELAKLYQDGKYLYHDKSFYEFIFNIDEYRDFYKFIFNVNEYRNYNNTNDLETFYEFYTIKLYFYNLCYYKNITIQDWNYTEINNGNYTTEQLHIEATKIMTNQLYISV